MKDQTEIAVVADCSGSMAGRVQDMIGGFDTFMAEQAKLDKGHRLHGQGSRRR